MRSKPGHPSHSLKGRPYLDTAQEPWARGDTEGSQGRSRAGEPWQAGQMSMPRPHAGALVAGAVWSA